MTEPADRESAQLAGQPAFDVRFRGAELVFAAAVLFEVAAFAVLVDAAARFVVFAARLAVFLAVLVALAAALAGAALAGFTVRSTTVAPAAALRSDSMAFSASALRLYDSPVASVRP